MCTFGFRRRGSVPWTPGIDPVRRSSALRSRRGLWLLALLLPLAGLAQPETSHAERRPLVLILHSYSPGSWVDSLQRGLLRGLNGESMQVDLYVDYMDTGTIPRADYLEQLRQLYALKYRGFHFDLVIACDDNAFQFAQDRHRDLWPGTPVVFCGLDALPPAQSLENTEFTGLSENDDLGPLLRAIPRMLPQVRQLLVIGDDSDYARRMSANLSQVASAASPALRLEGLKDLSLPELLRRLEQAPPDAAVFYVSLSRDHDGRVIVRSEIERVLQHSAVPVFALRDSFVGHGALAATFVDGEEHGAAAGKLARQILLGTPGSSLPAQVGPARRIAFDAPSLAHFGISRRALPPGSVLLNQPFSFYDQYRTIVWITAGTIALLAGLVVFLVSNIVQRRRAVAQLKTSEGKFRAIFNQTFQLAGLLDTEGRLITVNSTALTFAGCTEFEVIGRFFWDTPWWTHDTTEQARVKAAVAQAAAGQLVRFETHHRDAAGELRTVDFTIKAVQAPDGRVLYLLPEGRDITDTKRTEEHLHAVLETAPLILWATDQAGIFNLSIGSGLSLLGLKPGQVVGQSSFEFYRDFPEVVDAVKRALAGESVRGLTKIGLRTFETLYAPRFGPNNSVIGSKGVALDVTERLQAQASRLQLATAVDQAAEQIVLTDAAGAIQYVNPAFEKVTGYSRDEAIGKTMRLLKSGVQDEAFFRAMWKTIGDGQVWTGRIQNRRRDGTLYLEDSTITPLLDEAKKVQGFVAVKRDVTQQVQLEETLRQTQRTEAIGKLAGGVAHDFNNILQVIKTNISFARELTTHQKELDEYLAQIDQAANRAAGLTRQLLAFGRKQALQFSVIEPAQTIADILKLIGRLIGAHIQVDFDADPGLDRIRADAGQLEQVVLNLCVNARDAMPKGGQLTLTLRNVTLAPQQLPPEAGLRPGRYVELAVNDTGVGMDPETAARIFEPFFTTKAVGQGTGLGLSVVQGIVHQHTGFVRVDSKPGQGSTFRVWLPSVVAELTAPAASAPPTQVHRATNQLILLAEDEPSVRLAATKILEHHGYRLLIATNGEEACQLATEHLAEISLLLFDVVMPRLSGIEAAKRLRQLRPELPVVLCSGYASGLPEGGLSDARLVSKPYAPNELIAAIQAALKKNASG